MKISDRNWLLLAISLGITARAIHLFFFSQTPFFTGYFLDELYHDKWAQMIANGNLLPNGVFFRAPLYPYFLGLVYFIFGDGPLAPRIVQMLWGIGSIVAVWFVGKQLIQQRLGMIIATILWAICPILIYYEARLLLDAPFAATFPWLILLAIKSRQKSLYIWFTGILLGLMAITRPTVLLVFPIITIFIMWGNSRPWFVFVKLVTGTAIILAPVTISNIFNGDFVLVSSQCGINFYIGNNPRSDGISAIVPEFGYNWRYQQCRSFAEREIGKNLSPSQVSSFFMKKGISFWVHQPCDALKLLIKKMWFLIGATEIGNNGNIYFLFDGSPLRWFLWLGWPLIFVLAIVGFRYSNFYHQAFFAALAVVYMLGIISFFVCSRFRLPVIAVLVVPAGAGFSAIIELIARRRFIPIVLLIILYGLLWFDPWRMRNSDDALSRFALGNIYFRQGKYTDALIQYRRALKLVPEARGINLNIGSLFFKIGEVDSARKYFEVETSIVNGEKSRAINNLSFLARIKNDTANALSYSKKALEQSDSTDVVIWFNRIKTLFWAGDFENTVKEIEFSLNKVGDIRILNLAGTIFLAMKDTTTADRLFELATMYKFPELIEWYDLGALSSELVGLGSSIKRVRAMAFYNRGQIAVARNEWKCAESLFALAIKADTSFALSYSALGTLALARKQFFRADTFLGIALSLGDSSIQTLFNFAGTRFKLGDTITSTNILGIISKKSPEFFMTEN